MPYSAIMLNIEDSCMNCYLITAQVIMEVAEAIFFSADVAE